MLCWPLFVTSLGFFIPAYVALRSRKMKHALATGTLAITSVLYHGTLHPLIHLIDKTYAHTVGIVCIVHSVYYHCIRRKTTNLARTVLGILTIYAYWFHSRTTDGFEGACWHFFVHTSAISSLILHCKPSLD